MSVHAQLFCTLSTGGVHQVGVGEGRLERVVPSKWAGWIQARVHCIYQVSGWGNSGEG